MSERTSSVGFTVAARHGMAVVLWVLRYLIQGPEHRPPLLVVVALDAVILATHWWANRPLRRARPDDFGDRSNLTWHLITPEVIAAFFLVRDLWFALHGTSI